MRLLRNALIAALGFSGMALAADQPGNRIVVRMEVAALHGQVTSAEEGAMEGVLVSARRDGSSITRMNFTDSSTGLQKDPARSAYSTRGIRCIGSGYRMLYRPVQSDISGWSGMINRHITD